MKSKLLLIPGLLAFGLTLGATATGSAQPRYQPTQPAERQYLYIDLLNPLGRPVTDRQDQYHYVVPSTNQQGSFYEYDKKYYYTPPLRRVEGLPPQPRRPVPVEFGSARHLPELAARLEYLANEYCLELHYNYQQNRGFDNVYHDAYDFLQAAKFIRVKENQRDLQAIRRSAQKIDNLFHHIQEDVSRFRRQERRPIGERGLQSKTEVLQSVLHHLLYDLGVKPEHDGDHHDDHDDDRRPPRTEAPAPSRNPRPRP